jgi:hypothetical protein
MRATSNLLFPALHSGRILVVVRNFNKATPATLARRASYSNVITLLALLIFLNEMQRGSETE